jgi:hypothetical protein
MAAESGTNMAHECLLDSARKVLASDSVNITAFTSPLGPEDWTVKFRERATDIQDSGSPMIGVFMNDTMDYYSLEKSEMNTFLAIPGDAQPTGLQQQDFTWAGAAYVHDDAGYDRVMLPVWSSSTFIAGGSVLANSQPFEVNLRNNVDHFVTMRFTRASGVQVCFGEDGDWKDLPGGRSHFIDRFNAKIEETGLARAFVRMHPDAGSVSLLSFKGDLYALKRELQVARRLGASAAEIQEACNEAAGANGVDDRAAALNQLKTAINDFANALVRTLG